MGGRIQGLWMRSLSAELLGCRTWVIGMKVVGESAVLDLQGLNRVIRSLRLHAS